MSALTCPVLALATLAVALPATASADERPCRGAIGNKTVDDLRVPKGATCKLTGTTVKGNIKVKRAAVLVARDVRVDGNVQGENAKRVNVVQGSRVEGDVQAFSGRAAKVSGSDVGGNVQFDGNRGALRVLNARVDGDVQLFENGGDGVKRIRGNRIDGNLQCKENEPAPTGGNNVVTGNKEDQCSGL